MTTTALTRTALVVLATALTVSACATDPDEPAAPEVTTTPSGTIEPAAPEATTTPSETVGADDQRDADALAVDISTTGISCLNASAPIDLAWFDATWKAHADLGSFSFALTNPVGVKQVGSPVNAPAVNFGGRIDFGGSAAWSRHAKPLLATPFVSWPQRGDTAYWSPTEDQSGLLVFHIRLDPEALASPEGASFDGVTATYRDLDGHSHEVTAEGRNVYTFDAARCDV